MMWFICLRLRYDFDMKNQNPRTQKEGKSFESSRLVLCFNTGNATVIAQHQLRILRHPWFSFYQANWSLRPLPPMLSSVPYRSLLRPNRLTSYRRFGRSMLDVPLSTQSPTPRILNPHIYSLRRSIVKQTLTSKSVLGQQPVLFVTGLDSEAHKELANMEPIACHSHHELTGTSYPE